MYADNGNPGVAMATSDPEAQSIAASIRQLMTQTLNPISGDTAGCNLIGLVVPCLLQRYLIYQTHSTLHC